MDNLAFHDNFSAYALSMEPYETDSDSDHTPDTIDNDSTSEERMRALFSGYDIRKARDKSNKEARAQRLKIPEQITTRTIECNWSHFETYVLHFTAEQHMSWDETMGILGLDLNYIPSATKYVESLQTEGKLPADLPARPRSSSSSWETVFHIMRYAREKARGDGEDIPDLMLPAPRPPTPSVADSESEMEYFDADSDDELCEESRRAVQRRLEDVHVENTVTAANNSQHADFHESLGEESPMGDSIDRALETRMEQPNSGAEKPASKKDAPPKETLPTANVDDNTNEEYRIVVQEFLNRNMHSRDEGSSRRRGRLPRIEPSWTPEDDATLMRLWGDLKDDVEITAAFENRKKYEVERRRVHLMRVKGPLYFEAIQKNMTDPKR